MAINLPPGMKNGLLAEGAEKSGQMTIHIVKDGESAAAIDVNTDYVIKFAAGLIDQADRIDHGKPN